MEKISFYTDYRKYLKDFFEESKKHKRGFSLRAFNLRAGVISPSFFLEVIQGKRNLSDRALTGCIKGLKLNQSDSKYFSALVNYNQSKRPEEKQLFLEKMRGLRRRVKEKIVPLDLYDYYAKWYNIIIREQASLLPWKDDYKLLAKSLYQPISVDEARESIRLLLKLGFLKREADGSYVQSDPVVTTGSEVVSLAVREFNRKMAEFGEKAINLFPPSERDISSLVVGVSKQGYSLIKEEIQDFKERIKRIAINDDLSEDVYNINVQLFPMAKSLKKLEGA